MKDNVARGTGNSRFLKSAISSSTTWEQFRAMLMAGNLPIDLNGINPAGWQVLGDTLSKANLLPDEVATALGLTQSNPQVKDALSGLLNNVENRIVWGEKEITVSKAGTTIDVDLGFQPKLAIVYNTTSSKITSVAVESGSAYYNVVPRIISAVEVSYGDKLTETGFAMRCNSNNGTTTTICYVALK